jgi:hypothetical protein
VLAVKENQEQLYSDVVDSFGYAAADHWKRVAHDHYRSVESGHGRIETREYWLVCEADYLAFLNPKGRGAIWAQLGWWLASVLRARRPVRNTATTF